MIPVLLYLTLWRTHQKPLEFTVLSFVAPKYFIAECSRVEKGSIVDSTTEEKFRVCFARDTFGMHVPYNFACNTFAVLAEEGLGYLVPFVLWLWYKVGKWHYHFGALVRFGRFLLGWWACRHTVLVLKYSSVCCSSSELQRGVGILKCLNERTATLCFPNIGGLLY